MFKISSQEEFGLRFLVQLAKANGREVSLSDIAEKEGTSLSYVRKILGILRSAGLVISSKGVKGGSSLSRSPSEITLVEIFHILKPEPHEFSCKDFTGNLPECANFSDCGVRPVMSLLRKKVNEFLSNITLSQLVKEEKDVLSHLQSKLKQEPQYKLETAVGS
ncbi:MAG: Rrf2 family transcriptional regulator [Candidatus Caenarcaniphilales bacterium]|nr:Rrf2 family transcriptional regulator [Candidatus Caenarcaniphilales bacterium]